MAWDYTFSYFDPLHSFIIHSCRSLLDQLIALDAEIEYFGPLNTKSYKFLHDIVHDVSRSLGRRKKIEIV
jgi:hypothetical protein